MNFIRKGMHISTIFINLSLLVTVLSFLSPVTDAQTYEYLFHECKNVTNLSSTYEANRDNVLSWLSSNASRAEGFYNTTSGSGTYDDTVYGLFLCRGDVSTFVCQVCLNTSTTAISRRCPGQTTGVIFYEECLLRYSDENFFSFPTEQPTIMGHDNSRNDTEELERFSQEITVSMNTTITQAVNQPSGAKKFAARQINIVSSSRVLYTLAQCTPDLSVSYCDRCLRRALTFTPAGFGSTLTPSCIVQYDFIPFYNQTTIPLDPQLPRQNQPEEEKQNQSNRIQLLVGSLSAIFGLAVVSGFGFFICRRRNIRDKENSQEIQLLDMVNEHSRGTLNGDNVGKAKEFPSIKLDILHAATNHFSSDNKLGAGGFGPVYKGTLADGKEIAVKRLSRTSGQGLVEFKNEVMLIAKLQHRNLVRLLGCCLEKDEKLLVYEFMPNRSLDVFLFDSNFAAQLDWQKRFIIIKGIARGILYLHEDSRLKIIHRDLKASNVLLDHKMNPKISDFGLARIFREDKNEANTNRVVGTYGYMAPEYAMEGVFSIKSDVFSFGVLLLEIISGKKNNGFHLTKSGESLLTFAWKLWSKGEGMELIDELLVQSCEASEVLKCIHIGLLCVQDDPSDRPTMSSVIVMLGSDGITTFPPPTEPSFFVGRVVAKPAKPVSNDVVLSINEVTISDLSPR